MNAQTPKLFLNAYLKQPDDLLQEPVLTAMEYGLVERRPGIKGGPIK
jgi:hypothetical protein